MLILAVVINIICIANNNASKYWVYSWSSYRVWLITTQIGLGLSWANATQAASVTVCCQVYTCYKLCIIYVHDYHMSNYYIS